MKKEREDKETDSHLRTSSAEFHASAIFSALKRIVKFYVPSDEKRQKTAEEKASAKREKAKSILKVASREK
jgi:hypothetical protein